MHPRHRVVRVVVMMMLLRWHRVSRIDSPMWTVKKFTSHSEHLFRCSTSIFSISGGISAQQPRRKIARIAQTS